MNECCTIWSNYSLATDSVVKCPCPTKEPHSNATNYSLEITVVRNRVLRRIFGPRRDEVRRKLHNEELHNLYSSPSIIRMIKAKMIR
jgi:hypothetical protein